MIADCKLPKEIVDDIDECFCFVENVTYQSRAHAYIANHRVQREFNDTAVHAAVTDIAKRAFLAGKLDSGEAEYEAVDPHIAAMLYETAGKMIRCANEIGEMK